MITDLQTLPITLDQCRLPVDHDTFAGHRGQVELIYGRIVKMNPQGPMQSPSGTNYEQVITHQTSEIISPACLPTAKLTVARLFSETTQD